MAYLFYKKTAKKNLLKKMNEYQRSGTQGVAAVNLWCEFCAETKKRWELALVGPESLTKIKDEFLRGALAKAPFIMACEDCIQAHDLEPLKDNEAGKWDGEKEAMKEIFVK